MDNHFLNRCFLFDIEINENNELYSLGGVLSEQQFLLESGRKINKQHLEQFDALAAKADFILGHNILAHDLPHLAKLVPQLQLHTKLAIDTLYLSPLAHPENPYHRLVKNYQIVHDSINNPAEDARLAGQVFVEQCEAFAGQLATGSDAPLLYRGFFHQDPELEGLSAALGMMGAPLLTGDDLCETFAWFIKDKVCKDALQRLVDQLADNQYNRAPLAYVTAWLTVAGGNSILPPWVRHHFPEVAIILNQLREIPCDNPSCVYCKEQHHPQTFLQNFFGFEDFRPTPADADGKSLQQEIVHAAARNSSLFAVLPTGGGKSLCYLLPALMRYQRRNTLTIVISPLQALMKDQVDNFARQTGNTMATALYGLLTLPERAEVMERIRLGDVGILYVSPEQLRNNSFVTIISQREIGAWVFDEAHCLSKWGHDFRTDYLYAIRFIREFAQREKTKIPPVQCFTATAKKDVKSEIIDILQSELGLKVIRFEGGHERSNLHYEVQEVSGDNNKDSILLELLHTRYNKSGSVVIYCATRNTTEQVAERLQDEGFTAESFHSKVDPSEKKRILEEFIAGDVPIICATNAFGMGIDKEDVRLVIHFDIPGSLENYLQEAGRAGRDKETAECILIYVEDNIETQFGLSSMSQLTKREIGQLLKGVRHAAREKKAEEVVLTPGELMRRDDVEMDPDDVHDYATRVHTAISWLERAGFLERNENNTRVFQCKPGVRSMAEAQEKISGLDLSSRQQERWLSILATLMEQGGSGRGLSADELAGHYAFNKADNESDKETEAQRVIRTLNDMADKELLTTETSLSAYIRYKVADSSEKLLERVCSLERDFLQVLEETAPDAETEVDMEIDLRQVNQELINRGHAESTPRSLNLILNGLSRDGKGIARQKGSISIRSKGQLRFAIALRRDWQSLKNTVGMRQHAAKTGLRVMLAAIPPKTPPKANLLVEFTLEALVKGLKATPFLHTELQIKDHLAAAERALTFMNEQSIITLQQGLAVFHQAMTISLNRDKKGGYLKADFAPLETHYSERNFQIHVMNEYARQGMNAISAARSLVASYFRDEKEEFIKRFFPGREKLLQQATSEQSIQQIVDDLKNPAQERIVAAKTGKNILVLAGPGSGKTRVVAHRIAYLLRVKRVRPSAVLALCFNRSAVMGLRQRVRDLVGKDMRRITTLTFHGLALRLTGRSLVNQAMQEKDAEVDFSRLIKDAISLLKGESDVLGYGDGTPRDDLIGRYSHILVDEYQDIDEEQYQLISLLAGRTLKDGDEKMTIMAVGDDDQNIYRFRGANVDFIRRFHHDYVAEIHYLVENYRSTANIITASNSLISHNSDRMKTKHPIIINRARRKLPAGGNWEHSDSIGRGRVQILEVKDQDDQALALLDELKWLQSLEPGFDRNSCAVLARTWEELDRIRALFEQEMIPVSINLGRHGFPSLTRVRENVNLLEYLRENQIKTMRASNLAALLPQDSDNDNIWQQNLRTIIHDWREETNDNPQPVSRIEEYLYETLSEQRRAGNLGKGIFLSTVHSIKGLEFDHVFVLGGGWQKTQGADMEEERRLCYVAMSRARETLHLFSLRDHHNPHTALLADKGLIRRTVIPGQRAMLPRFHYEILGMKDLFLDYAGRTTETHPIHKALAELTTNDLLQAHIRNNQVELVDENISIARLSKQAGANLQPRLNSIREIRILAMIRRHKNDVSERTYLERCRMESWELPIVELKINDV